MDTINFVKMHGLGNDYVYIDAVTRPQVEAMELGALAQRMSDRHRGIGSDGLILVCKPTKSGAHVRMRMFNADGSESEMCGNGVRCVAKFAHDRLGVKASPMLVETGSGVLSISFQTRMGKLSSATVDMGEPILDAKLIPTTLPAVQVIDFPLPGQGDRVTSGWGLACGLDPRITCVSMGNPHAVLFCNDVRKVPLEQVGPIMERAPFFPNRTNVHFVQVVSKSAAIMRTWERGAGLTQACGTGACAVLVAGALTNRLEHSALLTLPGGDLLVRWDEASNHVFMTGPAEDVFEGVWVVAQSEK